MQIPSVRQPRLVQTLQWIFRPYPFMTESQKRLGDVFAVDVMGMGRLVLLSNPEDVAAVFSGDHDTLRAGESNALVEPLLGPTSLLVLDVPWHLQTREQLFPGFSRAAVDGYAPDMHKIASEIAEQIRVGDEFRIHPLIRRITLRFMLTAVFGACEPARFEPFYRAFTPLTGEIVGALAYLTPLQRDLGRLTPGRWFHDKIARLDRLIFREIEARRSGAGRTGGIIAHLLELRTDAGDSLSDSQIRDHIATMLAAGHETVGSAIAWAFHWIHATPDVLDRVRAEVVPPEANFGSARYLEAACLEALRITPVAEAVARVNTEPMEFGGFAVEPGCLVSPAIHLVHHRPDIYPQPERFRPERFFERRFKAYEFFPFGGGQRQCLGRMLAIEEMKIVLGTLLSKFEFQLSRPGPVKGVRRNVTIAPSGGVPVIARRQFN